MRHIVATPLISLILLCGIAAFSFGNAGAAPIPEPAVLALLLFGLAGNALARRG